MTAQAFSAGARRSLAAASVAALLVLHQPAIAAPLPPEGFWKCKAQGDVKGEFEGEDPVGLASGKHIPTNCAIRKRYDGKIYCFSSLPSLEFVDSDLSLLQQASAFWEKDRAKAPTR